MSKASTSQTPWLDPGDRVRERGGDDWLGVVLDAVTNHVGTLYWVSFPDGERWLAWEDLVKTG